MPRRHNDQRIITIRPGIRPAALLSSPAGQSARQEFAICRQAHHIEVLPTPFRAIILLRASMTSGANDSTIIRTFREGLKSPGLTTPILRSEPHATPQRPLSPFTFLPPTPPVPVPPSGRGAPIYERRNKRVTLTRRPTALPMNTKSPFPTLRFDSDEATSHLGRP